MNEPNYALNYIEIDVDYCSLTYSVPPCMAVLGTEEEVEAGTATGTIKCFNTLATCQDRANFTNVPVTLRFAVATDYLPADIERVAESITGIDYSAGVISLGEDLGQRASLTVNFFDHRSSDTGPGGDKYLADRDYVPAMQGTFWGKFRKRQNFLRGRPLRWIQGLVGQPIEEMDTRHFIVESFNGPTLDGRFTITAKDPLKLLDGDRAQAPQLSKGYLNAGITNVATAATLAPVGIGNSDYPASGYLNIGGKEIVAFSRVGDSLTLTRARYNTEAVAHEAGDRLQVCLEYLAEDPADVIADLEETYASIDPAWIPILDWQAETAAFYRRVVTTLIPEPTPVKKLVGELVQQCGLAHWWDEADQQLKLRVLRTISTTAERFDEDNTARNSLVPREQPDKRVSQVWVYFGQFNPLKSVDDTDNYRSTEIRVDLDAEEDYGSPAIKKIFSRWIPFGGLTVAQRLSAIQLGRFRTAPRNFSFSVFRRGSASPQLGEGCRLEGIPMQEATGALEDVPIQITRLRPTDATYDLEAEEMLFVDLDNEDPNTHYIIIDANTYNVDLKVLHDALYAETPDGITVNATINSGAIVGSSSTSAFALDIGSWPTIGVTGNRTSGSPTLTGIADTTGLAVGQRVFGTGIPAGAKILSIVTNTSITLDANASSGAGTSTALTVHSVIINLLLRGRVQGKGGNGGTGATGSGSSSGDGQPGLAGGPALYSRYSVNLFLDVGDAEVFGGGGGGGGAAAGNGQGGGGGGGSGSQPGSGATGGGTTGIAGTTENGGGGGSGSFSPSGFITLRGGSGGDPGEGGNDGDDYDGSRTGGAGGAAGVAIDGVSYFAKTGTGDIRGPEIN